MVDPGLHTFLAAGPAGDCPCGPALHTDADAATLLPILLAALALGPTDSTTVYRGSAGELRVAVPREADVQIRIDGRLDEEVWSRAAVLTGFTLYEPLEGEPAADETEILVFYTAEAIYFGIRAHDRSPDRIRATLVERDRSAFEDDWVRIMLDTFDDSRGAYCFYVNPYGIQTDGLWQEGGRSTGSVPIDFNQDFIWSSDGRIEENGWVAEIRIPYVSLRFRDVPVQDWGFNVARETRRNGYKMSWAPITQNQTSTLAQSGKLVGLRDLEPRRLVEMNPVLTGRRTGELGAAGFAMADFEQDFGVNARVGITQNLVLDATVNPDFSQVEADADQITVNERFALFLSEKRPFFLEGTEIFRTPQQLVYTRSIVDPVGGAKLTGKIGAFNVGYLGALDDAPTRDPGVGERAAVNLLRVRRDMGSGSTIGALYTDRTLGGGGGFNRVLSADARLLLGERYTLTTQLARSWTRIQAGPTLAAPLLAVNLARTGRRFGLQFAFEDMPDEFHAGAGFLRRVGEARALGDARVSFFGPSGAALERFNLSIKYEGFYTHEGLWDGHAPYESEVEISPGFEFRGANSLRFILRRGYFRFDPLQFEDIGIVDGSVIVPVPPPSSADNMLAVAIFPSLRPRDWIQLGGRYYFREIPIFQEGTRGFEIQAAPTLKLWPSDGLTFDLSFTHSRITRPDDSQFSTQSLSRLRTQYQFTKALFVRAIVQYNLQSRDALRDRRSGQPLVTLEGQPLNGFERGEFGFNTLISYEPSPGTLMYLGWARQMRGPETWRLRDYDRTAEGLFLKVSYLYRL
jgi:hypothetical protein